MRNFPWSNEGTQNARLGQGIQGIPKRVRLSRRCW